MNLDFEQFIYSRFTMLKIPWLTLTIYEAPTITPSPKDSSPLNASYVIINYSATSFSNYSATSFSFKHSSPTSIVQMAELELLESSPAYSILIIQI